MAQGISLRSLFFTKGPNSQKLTPADVLPSFKTVSLNWAVTVTAIDPELTTSNTVIVYPNPETGQFTVLGENIRSVEVADLSGKKVYSGQTPVFDLTKHPKGIYLVTIKTMGETFTQKVIKE